MPVLQISGEHCSNGILSRQSVHDSNGIIKYSFWQQVYQNRNATYACLNMEEERVPEEIQEQSVLINGDSAQVIQELIS